MNSTVVVTLFNSVSGAASRDSEVVQCPANRHLSGTFSTTGTLNGSFSFVGRNHPSETLQEVEGSAAQFATKQPAGAPVANQVNYSNFPFKYYAIRWTATIGEGNLLFRVSQGDAYEV